MLSENVERISGILKAESERGGFAVPELIAVTKTVGKDEILPLKELGIRSIAENRVQVLEEKLPWLKGAFNIHLIGRLQRNKVKYIINDVCMIHSVDNMPLAQEIDRQAKKNGRVMPVLIEINIAGEEQKGGVRPEEALPLIREAAKLDGIRIRGLMTMMPALAEEEAMLRWFTDMRLLRDRIRNEAVAGTDISELSMGMSRDFHLAARCGATMVRVGRSLFAPDSFSGAAIP